MGCLRCMQWSLRLSLSLGDEFGTLECLFRSNVIIRRAHKAIQGDDCRPRRRSWLRLPWLTPIRNSFK